MILTLSFALAATLAGVTMPDTATVGTEPVVLNGLGLREKYTIDIYVGGLYLRNPTRSGTAAIAADEPKRVVMQFIYRAVTRQQMLDTFYEGFGDAAKGAHADSVAKMQSWVPADGVKRGDRIAFDYAPGAGTTMTLNGRALGNIPGAEFMKLVFGIFLGPRPPTEALKAGLLGG